MLDKLGWNRFWQKVDKSERPNGCWLWLGGARNKHYFQFRWNAKTFGVMKLAYQYRWGEMKGKFQPECGFGTYMCCRPDHLVLKENRQCAS